MCNVAIVILNYLDFDETIRCVNDYLLQSLDVHIVVVDNHSPNESFCVLSEYFSKTPNVSVIDSGFNGGYAYGNNIGIRFLEANLNVSTIIISNNDIVISDHDLLLNWFNMHNSIENVGITAPKMLVNSQETNYSAWKSPTFMDDLKSNSVFLEKLVGDNKCYPKSYLSKTINEVDCLPGSLFMVNIEILRSVGYFDEGTFLYMEEVILSHKIRNNLGLKNYLISSLLYEHLYSKTISSVMSKISMRNIVFKSNLYYASRYRVDNHLKLILLIASHSLGNFIYKLFNKGR